MKLLIDSADIKAIKELYEILPISGVTTNPSILYRQNKNPKEVLFEIKEIVKDDEMHIQAIGTTCKEFVEDAKAIAETLGKDICIKIPAIKEGYKAMKILKKEGYHITATAIYYESQALLASSIGVDYIAPYYNRICKEGMNGIEVISSMKKIIEGTDTKILAASFKTEEQVARVASLSVEAMTLSPDVYNQLTDHQKIDDVTRVFNEDFYSLIGSQSTLKDILST